MTNTNVLHSRNTSVFGLLAGVLWAFLVVSTVSLTSTYAGQITIDFSNGLPHSSVMDISAVNGGTFNFTGGTLNVTMDTPGDGVLLKPNIFNPDCFQFQELSLDGFGEDDVFLMDFRFGNPQDIEVKIRNKPGLIGIFIDIRLVEDGNVKETVSTGKNGVTTDDIGAIRVDFLGNGMLSTQVFDNNGNQIGNTGHLSGVVGFGDEPIEVTIVGEDIMRDPVFHLGTLTLTTTHVPEPSTLTLLGIGALTVFGYVCKRHKRLYGSKEAH